VSQTTTWERLNSETKIENNKSKDMKRVIILAIMLASFVGVRAQDCFTRVLPRFQNDSTIMAQYPMDKIMYWCYYSQVSLYESDTIPTGVDVYNISQVHEVYGDAYLPQSYVVDLTTLNYFAYNFLEFQHMYPTGSTTICFATPSSTHPYLVLRSLDDTQRLAEIELDNYYRSLGY